MCREQLVWLVLVGIVGSFYFIRGDLHHFTWWSLLVFLLYSIVGTLTGKTSSLFWFFATIQWLVIGGVLVMSTAECALFTTTEEDVGPLVYYFGNFFMHYALLLFALALVETNIWSLQTALNDIACGLGLFLTYTELFDPFTIYECTLDRAWLYVGTLGIGGSLIVLQLLVS